MPALTRLARPLPPSPRRAARMECAARCASLAVMTAMVLLIGLPTHAVAQTTDATRSTETTAWSFSGDKTVFAVMGDGSRIHIARLRFTPAAGGAASYELQLQHEPFTDHFLSMREFKCLAGGPEISCYVPYPYANPRTVGPGSSAAELAWLEHGLMFLHKSPAEFGAKLWNGLIFGFKVDGARLVGTPQAIDLNEIASPPRDLKRPPFGKAQRHEVPEGTRWLRRLEIE